MYQYVLHQRPLVLNFTSKINVSILQVVLTYFYNLLYATLYTQSKRNILFKYFDYFNILLFNSWFTRTIQRVLVGNPATRSLSLETGVNACLKHTAANRNPT